MNIPLIVALIMVSVVPLRPAVALTPAGAIVSLGLVALLCLVAPAAGCFLYRSLRGRDLSNPTVRARALVVYRMSRTSLSVLSLVVFYVQLSALAFPQIVFAAFGYRAPILAFKLVCLAPYLATTVLLYWPRYRIDRVLGIGASRSFASYASFCFRTQVLLYLVPWSVLSAAYDFLDSPFVPEFLREPEAREYITVAFGFVMVALVFTVAPLFLRLIWSTRRLPDSPLRRRLESFARRLGFTFRDVLIWDTQGTGLANAAVAGLCGFCRYVFITDTLLEKMTEEEVLAVFGHEVAHAKLGHMPFFLAFLVAFSTFFVALSMPLTWLLVSTGFHGATATSAAVLLIIAAYWGGLFGYISRRFERQADLYGAGWTSVHAFVSALEKLSALNGVPRDMFSWRHGSIARRVGFLERTLSDPDAVPGLYRSLRLALGVFLAITCTSVGVAILSNFTSLFG